MFGAWLSVFGDAIVDLTYIDGRFNLTGIAPIAWWLFALMLGAAAGAVFRRTLPAMAVAVAGAFLLVVGLQFARPYYAEPERMVSTTSDAAYSSGAKLVSWAWVDPAGKEMAHAPAGTCAPRADLDSNSAQADREQTKCLIQAGYRHVTYHHPVSWFERFQWTEAAILFVLTLGLTGLTVHRVRRRRI